ncbi:MAG: hypothetical protein AB7F08_05705 [Dongiaceae bacterium]
MSNVAKFWDDAMLVAYVDGELDAATARRLENAIAEDAAAQASIRLLRESASAARGAFVEILETPVPAALVDRLRGGASAHRFPDPKTAPSRTGGGHAVSPPRRPGLARRLLPLAAGLLLVTLGFAGGLVTERGENGGPFRTASGPTPGNPAFEQALRDALAADRIGARLDYRDEANDAAGSITLTGSFTAGFGASCREFRHERARMGTASVEDGIACRRGDGGWEIITLEAARG